MSLFGSSPDDSSLSAQPARANQKSSLFDDEQTPGAKSGSSLFDDEGTNGASPWDMPTPKKSGRNDLVKRLLPASDVPESYIDAFDALRETSYKAEGGQIGTAGARKLLEGCGLDASGQDKILKLVTGGQDTGLGRSEFNVLLALIGLSQESEEASLDSVDERRRNLPEPSIPFIKQIRSAKVSENLEETSPELQAPSAPPKQKTPGNSPPKSRRIRKDSLENLDHDPWSSPALHKGHTHIVNNEATPSSNPTAAKPIRNGLTEPSRTTSAFTTYSDSPSSPVPSGEDTRQPPMDGGSGGWGSEGPPSSGFPNTGHSGGGFGSSGDDQGNRTGGSIGRSLGGGRTVSRGVEETVTVTLLPEKEGMFMFQHHNYEVKSARRASLVVRRYSDFVWLLDLNGRHLSADVTFMEKRRRGLVRFVNTLVRHPVLSQEQLVVMFLTVPTHQELAVWRKQATISVQEEFVGKTLPSGLEDSLPTNLSETFDTVRSGVRESSEKYIGLCGLLERLAKRNQGIAADYLRLSQALMAVTEMSQSTYATDTNDVPLLNEGISSTAKHLTTSQSLLEDEARAWDEGVLEDFKNQRDTLVSIRDMFDRRDRYAKDNIPYLERRIESNENKLAGLMGRPEGAPARPGEQEKLEQAVRADKQSIVDQHARGVFIKECIRDELAFFQQSQYQVSRLHQDWSQERVKYAELQADNWRALSEEVDNMPLGE
ncbi:MAG: Sorting nexin mvp1 [Alectoria sarmentosa]|nr:MAG: Sorting nexin mvp1 [Alectoria sarmentosa]